MDVQYLRLFLIQPKVLPERYVLFEIAVHMVGQRIFGDAWTGWEIAASPDDGMWTLRIIRHLDRLSISEEEKQALFAKYKTGDHLDRLETVHRWLQQRFFTNKTGTSIVDPDGKKRAIASHIWGSDQAEPMLETGRLTVRRTCGKEYTACLVVHASSLYAALGYDVSKTPESDPAPRRCETAAILKPEHPTDGVQPMQKGGFAEHYTNTTSTLEPIAAADDGSHDPCGIIANDQLVANRTKFRGYEEDDAALLNEMAQLLNTRKFNSRRKAAMHLAQKAKGSGTLESKADRLRRGYKKLSEECNGRVEKRSSG